MLETLELVPQLLILLEKPHNLSPVRLFLSEPRQPLQEIFNCDMGHTVLETYLRVFLLHTNQFDSVLSVTTAGTDSKLSLAMTRSISPARNGASWASDQVYTDFKSAVMSEKSST